MKLQKENVIYDIEDEETILTFKRNGFKEVKKANKNKKEDDGDKDKDK